VTPLDYSILCNKINDVEEKFQKSINHINFGEKELFILDLENHPDLDPTLQMHSLLQSKTKNLVKDLIQDFNKNILLRDFFCCNFVEICKNFYTKNNDQDILEHVDVYSGDIELLKFISLDF
jgi:hypothetical protein